MKKYHHSSYWVPSRFWVVHQQISVYTIMPLAHLLPKYIHLESNLSLKFHVPQPWPIIRKNPRDCGHIGWLDLGRWIREATENHDESPQCYLWFWEETPEKPTRSETNSSQLNHWSRKISFLLKDGLLAASMLLVWGEGFSSYLKWWYIMNSYVFSSQLLPRISTLLSIWSSESMAGGVWYSSTLGIQLAESLLKKGHPKTPKPTK